MVFRKRAYVGIESGNKRFKASKKSAPLKAQVSRLKRQVAALKPEVKISYQTSSNTNLTSSGVVVPLSLVAEGVTDELRIGDSIKPVHLNLNAQFASGFSSGTSLYKFIVFKDKRSNGVLPTIAGASTSVFEGFAPQSAMVQHQGQTRFKVLAEYDISEAELLNGTKYPMAKFSIPLSGTTTYIDGTGAIGGNGDNHYYLAVMTDSAANTIDTSYHWQFMFTDA